MQFVIYNKSSKLPHSFKLVNSETEANVQMTVIIVQRFSCKLNKLENCKHFDVKEVDYLDGKTERKANKQKHSTDYPATRPPFSLICIIILVKSVKEENVFSFPNANSNWKIA